MVNDRKKFSRQIALYRHISIYIFFFNSKVESNVEVDTAKNCKWMLDMQILFATLSDKNPFSQ